MQESPRMEGEPEQATPRSASNDEVAQRFDFRAIDLATAKPVAPDAVSFKEEDQFKKAIRSEMQRLVVRALRLGAIILGTLLVVRFWHLAAPSGLRWLTDVELQAMDKMLFSSAFGGFVLTYLKDAMSTNK
ncbi:hypothetical protein ACYX79_13405 [Stenotrophomonas rhizophila]